MVLIRAITRFRKALKHWFSVKENGKIGEIENENKNYIPLPIC